MVVDTVSNPVCPEHAIIFTPDGVRRTGDWDVQVRSIDIGSSGEFDVNTGSVRDLPFDPFELDTPIITNKADFSYRTLVSATHLKQFIHELLDDGYSVKVWFNHRELRQSIIGTMQSKGVERDIVEHLKY